MRALMLSGKALHDRNRYTVCLSSSGNRSVPLTTAKQPSQSPSNSPASHTRHMWWPPLPPAAKKGRRGQGINVPTPPLSPLTNISSRHLREARLLFLDKKHNNLRRVSGYLVSSTKSTANLCVMFRTLHLLVFFKKLLGCLVCVCVCHGLQWVWGLLYLGGAGHAPSTPHY